MANPVGPAWVGRFEEFVVNAADGLQYRICYFPDRANDELQRAGDAPCFYWVPNEVRLSRKGDIGDYKFHHTHFVGTFDEDTNVGIANGETQGGILGFTTTSSYPVAVLQQAQEQLLAKFRGSDEKYWGWRTPVAPRFAIAPIVANVTAVSNVVPGVDGSPPPALEGGGGGNGAGAPRGVARRPKSLLNPRSVPHGRAFRGPTALDPWGFRLFGQGPGNVLGGDNAYSAVMGPLPSEILWAGFHGSYSPIVVVQNLQLQMWSQLMRIKIEGNWDRVFEHFSAAAQGRYFWFSADIKAEFNNLRINGGIKVHTEIDGTVPGGAEMEEAINKRIDTIVAQFTEIAKKVIFDPAPPQVEAAQASSGGLGSIFGFGAGVALKYRRDETNLNLSYDETKYVRFLQPHTISSSMEGFFNEIKSDPEAERKYFTRLVLGQLGRKIKRIVKPVVNWPNPSQGWVGEPVSFLSCQVGYPNQDGTLQWKADTFQASDAADRSFVPVFVQWMRDEVTNPPASWEPDDAFLKRRVHMLEPPGETEYPHMRVQVENNVIELDQGENGTLGNDNIVEVRADRVGVHDLGPILMSVMLETEAQMVEVEFRPRGRRSDGTDRSGAIVRFRWTFNDQNESRFWRIFTGQPDYVTVYDYRVHVTVRGTLFTTGMAWSGPWVTDVRGNGPLLVAVPGPGDQGVVTRRLTPREIVSRDIVRVQAPAAGVGQPGVIAPGAATGLPASGGSGGIGAPRRNGGGVGAPYTDRGGQVRRAPDTGEVARDDLTIGFVPMPAETRSQPRSQQAAYGEGRRDQSGVAGRRTAARSVGRGEREPSPDETAELEGVTGSNGWTEMPGVGPGS